MYTDLMTLRKFQTCKKSPSERISAKTELVNSQKVLVTAYPRKPN